MVQAGGTGTHAPGDGVTVATEIVAILRERDFGRPAARLARALDSATPSAGHVDRQVDSRPAAQGRAAADRHLAGALTASRAGPHTALAVGLSALAPRLRWRQTEAYVAAPPYAGFLDHYAHATLLGPAGLAPLLQTPAADVRLGLLLLGPFHAYPPHAHPAEEIYLPLTSARWSAGDHGPDGVRRAGSLIHHHPEQPHAVTTEATPLLAVYLWLGDTAASSRFVRASAERLPPVVAGSGSDSRRGDDPGPPVGEGSGRGRGSRSGE